MKPFIAIVGRPNVGKSTLFNRLTRSKAALVDDFPGVTRDRHYADTAWDGKPFTLIDTGGFLLSDEDMFASQIRHHVEMAVEEADLIIFLLDGKAGLSPFDHDLAAILRRCQKPVFYFVNKAENFAKNEAISEFYALGTQRLYPISAEHNIGISDAMESIMATFWDDAHDESFNEAMEERDDSPGDDEICIAVAGRPNVGKSSLINKLFGEERLVVSEHAGTTRDAVDLSVERNGRRFRFIDTAGIRRKGKVKEKIEKFSIIKSLKSLDRCDVALILIDASEGITDQDVTIAGYARERGCGALFLINKWDLLEEEEKDQKRFMNDLRMKAKFLSYAPAMTISALTGQRTHKIFSMVEKIYDEYAYRINTGLLNRIIDDAVFRTEPSLHKGKRLKFYYATQVATKPPSIVCFVNYPEAVHFSYKRYLLNQIREMAELEMTPINLYFREKTGKIDFSQKMPKTNANIRYAEKGARKKEKRKKERMEQQRRKRVRESHGK